MFDKLKIASGKLDLRPLLTITHLAPSNILKMKYRISWQH